MVYFTICGPPDCPFFVHAAHVAAYLKSKLPNFDFEKIQLEGEEWIEFLREVHNKHPNWHQTKSPVIWKSVSYRGGKEYLIGSINEFWEYCYDYYGLESIICKEDLKTLCADNMEIYRSNNLSQHEKERNKFRILISGASRAFLTSLIPEILKVDNLVSGKEGVTIILQNVITDTSAFKFKEFNKDLNELSGLNNIFTVKIVETIAEGLQGTDLLITLNDLSILPTETAADHMFRNVETMLRLAEDIRMFSSKKLRILMGGDGPLCFNATSLLIICPHIRSSDIVVLSSDLGLGPISLACKLTGVKVETVSGPPVWGFIGTDHFVDLGSAVHNYDMYLPYRRAITNKGGSTLSQGNIHPEIRFMRYLTDELEIFWEQYEYQQSEIKRSLKRKPCLAKTRAIIDLLEYWFDKSLDSHTKVISLGICSNGTFGIPPGFVFSQPVYLDNNIWKPFDKFPLHEATKAKIQEIVTKSTNLLQSFPVVPSENFSTQTVFGEEYTI